MSARDHDLIEELLAVRALDGLDGEDTAVLEAAMAAHGAGCEDCRRLEVGFAETAAMLAFGLEPGPVPEDLADRIVAARGASIPVAAVARPGRTRLAWAAVAATAAAFALVAVLFAIVSPGPVAPPTVVRFQGREGELAMAYTPGSAGALLLGQGLPEPGPGKVYEIWMIRNGQPPVSGACVTPTDGHLAAVVDADVSTSNIMAVTIEGADCPSAPTTTPVYTATLS